MDTDLFLEIYDLISRGRKDVSSRKEGILLRKNGLNSIQNTGFVKLAFDTRRIDQQTQINPRRGLQNYHRSDPFISEAMSKKLKSFIKLRKVLSNLGNLYGKNHEWQDSNARVLLSTLDKGLRTIEKDGDFSDAQPSVGSLDYIEELLHVRYRLTMDDLESKSESELEKIILSKDPELTNKELYQSLEITKSDVGKQGYDSLIEKLFGGVKATSDGKSVERTVTITIRDSVVDEKKE